MGIQGSLLSIGRKPVLRALSESSLSAHVVLYEMLRHGSYPIWVSFTDIINVFKKAKFHPLSIKTYTPAMFSLAEFLWSSWEVAKPENILIQ